MRQVTLAGSDYAGVVSVRERVFPWYSLFSISCLHISSLLYISVYMCTSLNTCTTGDGKTHYIESQLNYSPQPLRVTVNESFMPLNAIKKLSSLPFNVQNCAVFFNISLLPPGVSKLLVYLSFQCVLIFDVNTTQESVDEAERLHYEQLLETVGWFFFDLFILGYVEDPVTGHSFQFPGGMAWAIYVEVGNI